MGFDLYSVQVTDTMTDLFSQYHIERRGSELYLYPRFMSHHRLLPSTLGFGYNGISGCDASACPNFAWPAPATPGCHCNTTYDQFCADNAAAFYAWGMDDPRVAAVLPFFWYSESAGSVGLEALPRCQAAWHRYGTEITAAAALPRPPRGSSCPGPHPDTPPPAKTLMPPGGRNWCSRVNT